MKTKGKQKSHVENVQKTKHWRFFGNVFYIPAFASSAYMSGKGFLWTDLRLIFITAAVTTVDAARQDITTMNIAESSLLRRGISANAWNSTTSEARIWKVAQPTTQPWGE
jgi:hypothetical protein